MPQGATRSKLPPDAEIELQLEILRARAEALARDTDRLDAYMANIRFIVTSFGFAIVGIAGIVGWLGFQSLEDIENLATESIDRKVESAFSENNFLRSEIDNTISSVEILMRVYQENKSDIESVKLQREAELARNEDPALAYFSLSEISDTGDSSGRASKLRSAKVYIETIISAALSGRADPELVFNAAVSASRLDMEIEAAKLAALAMHMRPTTSHRVMHFEKMDVSGREYVVDASTNSLTLAEKSSSEVRKKAWEEALAMVRSVSRVEGEQVYSRVANMALRNRSEGYYDALIRAIEFGERGEIRTSSYAYVTLAQLVTWRGDPDWKRHYRSVLDRTLATLQAESMASSWHQHTVRELLETAIDIDDFDYLIEQIELLDIAPHFTAYGYDL